MGLGARIGLSCWLCINDAALVLTLGVRRLGVRPRGDGRAHVGGKELSEEERLCYGIFHKQAADIVGRYDRRGQLMKNYAHILP